MQYKHPESANQAIYGLHHVGVFLRILLKRFKTSMRPMNQWDIMSFHDAVEKQVAFLRQQCIDSEGLLIVLFVALHRIPIYIETMQKINT